jgi:hypothetical protein
MLQAAMDTRFRITVLAGGALLVVVIAYLRFCGSLSLPAKPPPPTGPTGTDRELFARSIGSPSVYQSFLERDAAAAGVRATTVDDMSRKLPYRVDEAKHSLEPGQPPVEVAGLRLHVERMRDAIVLVMQNTVDAPVAYNVVTSPSLGVASCNSAVPLPFDANVIAKAGSTTRVECVWRDRMAIVVSRVETLELTPLQAWYLDQVPPEVLGIDERVARGHRAADNTSQCSSMVSAVIRGLQERGEITWRDLADFYARHRCQTYQFPSSYRAFKVDGERQLPAASDGS